MITIKINGTAYDIPIGTTILEACNIVGIYVPTLCNHPDIPPSGKCGVCVVKINGSNFSLSCSTKISSGMNIETNTPEIRRKAYSNLSSFTDISCLPMTKEIEEMINYFSIKKIRRTRQAEKTNSILFDPSLCINCSRCIRMCSDVQCIGALEEDSHSLNENDCIQCGQCITVCPTNALRASPSSSKVIRALASGKIMILQIAPSVRVSIGECFGNPIGTLVTGKIISAARDIGFHYIFDVEMGSDIVIIEEGTELIHRLNSNGKLPMFSSCCPSWINYVEKLHPDLIPFLSSTKSPHMCTGSIINSYFSKIKNIDPYQLFLVSLMPCTEKKMKFVVFN